jgi:prepilin-type N-terminal cleavage/methylation domain-containing protein
MPVTPTVSARRTGFTLLESLVALALTGFIAAILTALVGQSTRVLSDETAEIDQAAQINFANATLRALLSDVSLADSDVVTASDSSIVYQMTVGGGVVCDTSGAQLALAPDRTASGITFATWSTAPQPGDSVAILVEGPSPAEIDDRWSKHAITSIAHGSHRCLTSPLVDPVLDRGSIAFTFATTPPPPPRSLGRPVRVLRPARVALYRSASEWMMGFAEYDGANSRWHSIQPVAGPLNSYSRSGPSGLRFTFVDSLALPTSPGAAAAIQLQLSASTAPRRWRRRSAHTDSIRSTLPLPNRR